MPSETAAQALRKRLLVRLAAAGVLLVIGLAVLGWLQRKPPNAPALFETQPAAAPHAGAVTVAPNPLEAGTQPPGAQPAGPLALTQTPSEPVPANAAEPASSLVATGEVVASADAVSATTEGSAAATKPPAPAKEKLPRGPHLQAGVFAQAVNAEELKARLEAEGLPVYIESRVQIGPFKNRKEAEKMREKLKADGMTTVLIAQ